MKLERSADEVILAMDRDEYSTLMFLLGLGVANTHGAEHREFMSKLWIMNEMLEPM